MASPIRNHSGTIVNGDAKIIASKTTGEIPIWNERERCFLPEPQSALEIAATQVTYDNTASGLTATDTQAAIDELVTSTIPERIFILDANATADSKSVFNTFDAMYTVASALDGVKIVNVVPKGTDYAAAGTYNLNEFHFIGELGSTSGISFSEDSIIQLTGRLRLEHINISGVSTLNNLITTTGTGILDLRNSTISDAGAGMMMNLSGAQLVYAILDDSTISGNINVATPATLLVFAQGPNGGTSGVLTGDGTYSITKDASVSSEIDSSGFTGTVSIVRGDKAEFMFADNVTNGLTGTTVQAQLNEIVSNGGKIYKVRINQAALAGALAGSSTYLLEDVFSIPAGEIVHTVKMYLDQPFIVTGGTTTFVSLQNNEVGAVFTFLAMDVISGGPVDTLTAGYKGLNASMNIFSPSGELRTNQSSATPLDVHIDLDTATFADVTQWCDVMVWVHTIPNIPL
jgi:hypothetical protein